MVVDRLTESTVVRYLIAEGLLSPDAHGEVSVRPRASTHLNFAVSPRGSGAESERCGWFVKQGLGRRGRRALMSERAAYRELSSPPAPARLARVVPRLLHEDMDHGVLVFELLSPGESLGDRRRHAGGVSAGVGAAIGEALALVHELAPPRPGSWGAAEPPAVPSVILANRPEPLTLGRMSPADIEVIKLLQRSDAVRTGLDRLSAGWRREALIHGDFRWENCIPSRPSGSRAPRVSLVDWERAMAGDPCFDVGAAFGEYLRCWLSSMSVGAVADPDALTRSATRPLEGMRPEVAALWSAYARSRGLGLSRGRAVLSRSIAFAAVRLIGAAFEQTQDVERPPAKAVLAVQVAENLLTWRWEHGARTIGIEP